MQKMNRNKLKRQRKRDTRRKRAEEMAGRLIKGVLTDLTNQKEKSEKRAERLHRALGNLVAQALMVRPGPETYTPDWEQAIEEAAKALE